MLSINLDRETENYLADIISEENISSEELLKKLIYEHWQSLKPRKTLFIARKPQKSSGRIYTKPSSATSFMTNYPPKIITESINQFSNFKAGTRSNSRVFAVTRVRSSARE